MKKKIKYKIPKTNFFIREFDSNGSTNAKNGHAQKPALTTSLGQLWNVDCTKFMSVIQSESVECFFADPPFNLNKNYGSNVHDDLTSEAYLNWCKVWLADAVRILKPGGSLFVYNLPKWNLPLGAWLGTKMRFRNWITVDMKFSLPISGRLYPSNYSLLYFTKGERPNRFSPPRLPIETCRHCGGEIKDYGGYKNRMNPSGVNLSDVWTDISPVRHKKFKRRGPNELSIKMMDRILDIATKENDVVVDPFGGSGTTFITAELKGRRWLGSELGNCQPIIDRFKKIEEERLILEEVRENVNILFKKKALKLRDKNGYDNSRYRLVNGNGTNGHELKELSLFKS